MTISATRGSRPRRTGDTSFTLVELVLVLLAVALLAALAVPLLGRTGRSVGLRTAHYELLSLLRQARHTAAASGDTCTVHLRPVPGGYEAQVAAVDAAGRARPLREPWAQPVQLPAVRSLLQIPPDRGSSHRTELTIRFTPQGVSEDYVVELGTARPLRIEVRRPSGLVRLAGQGEAAVIDDAQYRAIEEYWQRHWAKGVR